MSTTISGTNGVTFPDSTSMQTGQQACKAWVNFNGTGTVAIRGSYNVSSITDHGTGDYTVNFTTAMPDVNYGWAINVERPDTNADGIGGGYVKKDGVASGSLRLFTSWYNAYGNDLTSVTVTVFSN